jgi:hypothetical protein
MDDFNKAELFAQCARHDAEDAAMYARIAARMKARESDRVVHKTFDPQSVRQEPTQQQQNAATETENWNKWFRESFHNLLTPAIAEMMSEDGLLCDAIVEFTCTYVHKHLDKEREETRSHVAAELARHSAEVKTLCADNIRLADLVDDFCREKVVVVKAEVSDIRSRSLVARDITPIARHNGHDH